MGNGSLEGRLRFGPLGINMNPLMIQGGDGELVDLLLRDGVKLRDAQLLSFVLLKLGEAADGKVTHADERFEATGWEQRKGKEVVGRYGTAAPKGEAGGTGAPS